MKTVCKRPVSGISPEFFIPFFFLLLLTACNDDGGSSNTPTDPELDFPLAQLNTLDEGKVYETDMKGTYGIRGKEYPATAFYSVANRAKDTWGIPQDKRERTNVSGRLFNVTHTYYYDDYGYLLQFTSPAGDCKPVTSDSLKLPDTVRVDDSGSLGSFRCPNVGTLDYSWAVRDGMNNTILLSLTRVFKDHGEDESRYEDIYRINKDGTIIALELQYIGYKSNAYVTSQKLSSY